MLHWSILLKTRPCKYYLGKKKKENCNGFSLLIVELGLIFHVIFSAEDPTSGSERPITVSEVEPLVKDFSSRWKAAIELMHNVVITSFSNFLCGMEILKASLTQLLLYYTRLSDCIKRVVGGSSQNKDPVSISSIIVKDFNYS